MGNEEKTMLELYNDSLKYYCYLDDAMGIDTSEYLNYEQCNCDKVKCFHDKVNGECYEDPDSHSRQLYEDIAIIYNEKARNKNFNIVKGINSYNFLGLFIETEDNRFRDKNNEFKCKYFSTDYIGPSRNFAKSIQVDSKMIGQTLRICRTIGGHIFWPGYEKDKFKTINCTRGGMRGKSRNPLCDRIDYTLAELKNFLNGKNHYMFDETLFDAFERYKDWFEIFGQIGEEETFTNFVNFMFLKDFVDKKFNVIDLSSYEKNTFEEEENPKPDVNSFKRTYLEYTKNLSTKILKRTERILEFARENHLVIQDTKE